MDRKFLLFWLGVALLIIGVAIVRAPAQETAPVPEKKFTITKTRLDEYVQQRIAKYLVDEETTLNQRVLKGGNWHTAVYGGVEYTVYTGPGQALATRWDREVEDTLPPQEVEDTLPPVE